MTLHHMPTQARNGVGPKSSRDDSARERAPARRHVIPVPTRENTRDQPRLRGIAITAADRHLREYRRLGNERSSDGTATRDLDEEWQDGVASRQRAVEVERRDN